MDWTSMRRSASRGHVKRSSAVMRNCRLGRRITHTPATGQSKTGWQGRSSSYLHLSKRPGHLRSRDRDEIVLAQPKPRHNVGAGISAIGMEIQHEEVSSFNSCGLGHCWNDCGSGRCQPGQGGLEQSSLAVSRVWALVKLEYACVLLPAAGRLCATASLLCASAAGVLFARCVVWRDDPVIERTR